MGSPNHFVGDLHDVVALVLHTVVGTIGSCDSRFTDPASQVSAHYCVGLDGTIHQYVDEVIGNGAWANGVLEPGNRWEPLFGSENPNHRTISVETEDNGHPVTEPVTEAQFDAVAALFRTVIQPVWPSITHLVAHCAISPQTRTCPASRWLDTGRFAELAATLGLTPLE